MASFSSSGVTDASPNVLVNIPGAIAAGQSLQQNALALSDRQTFRDNASGLVSRDPSATAAAMGADPAAATSYLQTIPYADQNTRAQSGADQAALGSVAGALINAAPAQRPALWAQARQQLIAGGHKNVPGPDYPGDAAMLAAHNTALSSQEQLSLQSQALTTTPQSALQAIPGGASPSPSPSSGALPGAANAPADANAMAARESGGDAGAVSPLGYAGKYQMGTAALTDAGVYQPAPGERLNVNQWAGTFNIPGFPQVKTLADFRANPAAQDAAYGEHVDLIDKAIASTPGADKFDASGLIAVAHLGGVSGMRKFVQTGGAHNPPDPNGTTLRNYYDYFSGHHPAGLVTALAQGGVAGVHAATAGGGKFGAPDAAGNVPLQVASNTNTAGMQPMASDVPAQTLPPVPSPSPADANFGRMLSGIGAPAAPGFAPGSQSQAQPGDQPMQNALLPKSVADTSAARPPPADAPMARNALALPPTPAAVSSATAAPPWNALGGPPPLKQPGTVVMDRAQQPPTYATGGAGPAASASAPPAASSPAGMQPLFHGNSYVEAPGMPGYVLGIDVSGARGVMRMPGAPPAKPPETKFVGGTMVQTDGVDGHVLNVVPNMVPDPSRMTQVTGAGPNGQNGTVMFQDGQPAGFVPASTQPIQMAAYTSDLARSGQVAQQATDAEQQVQRALEARNYAHGLPTGAGGEDRAAISTWLKTYAPDGVYNSFVKGGYLPDAPQAESAAKVMLGQAAMDEKTMGGSGGLGLTEKYAKANPSLNMTPQAIEGMSNLKAVTAQSAKDYADGYLQNFNTQSANFTKAGGTYQPASNFDQAWHGQSNVQTYMAAIDAMNGKPYADWSKGLSPETRQRALGVIGRVDPTSIVNGANGRIRVDGQPVQAGGVSRASSQSVPTATGPNGQKLFLRNGTWASQ